MIHIVTLFKFSYHAITHHKMRSLLTTLGIIIGVVAIIAVMSIGEGAQHKVTKAIESLGTNFILVLALPPKSVTQRGSVSFTLKPSDYHAIRNECSTILDVSPGVMFFGQVVYESSNWQTSILGANERYLDIRQWPVAEGEFFTAQDVRSGAKVAVLGKTVAQRLFQDRNPIGAIIRVKKIPFKVIGVLSEKGRSPDGRDWDDAIIAPVSCVLQKLLGKTNYSVFMMSAISRDRLATAAHEVRATLRQKHHLQEKDDDDFSIFTQDDISQASEAASRVLHLLLLIIASISLMVGGIGIMNIMLVTVTERTREIGIRMALGATTRSILYQFILEAVMICLFGGVLGIIIGATISIITGLILQWPIIVSVKAIAISLSSSVVIGLFFGFYPARKASMLDPVDALAER